MFLKSLTLRGFKSFADKTTLVYEPGVSVIVGPNGSGKSNIVDAISWVLGEQGPRSLRGGRMEDVIFAGSRLRPALGMAEVSMVIDNSAGLLPIAYEEVTVSRTLFRSGDSEYRLNGAVCRLLDVQELLSDTGIGREQHTIIGQGQLDAILTADATQLRGFIEEAAGVAKHRRRKERSLRKIASTEENVKRLSDLMSEIRRQLRPLREQAAVAERHSELDAQMESVRKVLAARRLKEIHSEISSEGVVDLEAPIRDKEAALSELESELGRAEAERDDAYAQTEAAREASWRLARLRERVEGLSRLASERERGLQAELGGATQESLRARLDEIASETASVEESLEEAKARAADAKSALAAAESDEETKKRELRSIELEIQKVRDTHRDLSGDAMRLRADVAANAAALEAQEDEGSRIADRRKGLEAQLSTAREAIDEAKASVSSLEDAEGPLNEGSEKVVADIAEAEDELAEAVERLRAAETQDAARKAGVSARESSVAEAARLSSEPGVIGSLGDICGRGPLRQAMDAIAGEASGVLVVEDAAAGARVLAKANAAISVVVAADPIEIDGAKSAASMLHGAPPSAKRALGGIFIVDDFADALMLSERYPGKIFIAEASRVASGSVLSRISTGSARGEDPVHIDTERLAIEGRIRGLIERRDDLMARLNASDAEIAAASERVTAAEREAHALERELAAMEEAAAERARARQATAAKLSALESRKPKLEQDLSRIESEMEEAQSKHSHALANAELASGATYQAKIELASSSEKRRLLEERRAQLAAALEAAEKARDGLDEKRERLRKAAEAASEISGIASKLSEAAGPWGEEADGTYRAAREKLESADAEIASLRPRRAALAEELDDLRRKAREEDLGKTELRVSARLIEDKMRDEWGMEPDDAVERYGHIWEVEEPSRITDPLGLLAVMDDKSLRQKEARLERDLEKMGRVNPLADQEFKALTEREEYLAGQISDLRRSRRHLLKVVNEVDDEIKELFSKAFQDASTEYERLFAMLFPGGEGRMKLLDPSDLLTSGVEVEARPGGKNLKRLSLLSGGEKALSALAFLFAIFRARPSPFYVLDEVEAALDDVNLHRFLALVKEFRETSQLLVVTHQKRTMEAADVLYGISIRPDGASRAISERLGDLPLHPEGSPAPSEEYTET